MIRMTRRLRHLLFPLVFAAMLAPCVGQELVTDYPGAISDWHGGTRHDFQVNGVSCIVVEPKEPAAGRPWYWKARFWDAFPYPEQALLARGWTIAYTDVADLYGAPEAICRFDRFYRFMTDRGFHPAPALAGYSRGGLIAINFASRFPKRLSCLYLDNAVCDYGTWPGGGRYPDGWTQLIAAYHFASNEEAFRSPLNPVTRLAALAKAGLPVLAICALQDRIVPPESNTLRLEQVFQECGGNLATIFKPEADHHPHSLEDPTPIVRFVQESLDRWHPEKAWRELPYPYNNDFTARYSETEQMVRVILWQWPSARRVFLSGLQRQPVRAWLNAETEKKPLPVVQRAEGWYIYLPEVPPAKGDLWIELKLSQPLVFDQPIVMQDETGAFHCSPDNGLRTADGTWLWKAYFPIQKNWLLQESQAVTAESLELGGMKVQLHDHQSLIKEMKAGVQSLMLHGWPTGECPRLTILPPEEAVIALPCEVRLAAGTPGAAWESLPVLPIRYAVVAEYACEADCQATATVGDASYALEFRATGAPGRLLRQPVGFVDASSGASSRFALQLCNGSVDIARLELVPDCALVDKALFSGEYLDIRQADAFTLPVQKAQLMGMNLRVLPGSRCVTHWANPAEYLLWAISEVRPGRYRVRTHIGTIAPSALAINAGGQTLFVKVPNTNDYDAWQPYELGVLEVRRAEKVWLQVFPVEGYTAVNLGPLELELLE